MFQAICKSELNSAPSLKDMLLPVEKWSLPKEAVWASFPNEWHHTPEVQPIFDLQDQIVLSCEVHLFGALASMPLKIFLHCASK